MKIDKDKNKRRLNPLRGTLLLLTAGLFTILFLLYFTERLRNLEKPSKNVDLTIFDNSIEKENPSVLIKIDNREIYSLDSISKSITEDFLIFLSPGKHFLQVSTLDSLYPYTDSILIENKKSYQLWIKFKHNPSIEVYKNFIANNLYERKIKKGSYTSEQKTKLFQEIKSLIDNDFEKQNLFKPDSCHFEAILMEGPFWIE